MGLCEHAGGGLNRREQVGAWPPSITAPCTLVLMVHFRDRINQSLGRNFLQSARPSDYRSSPSEFARITSILSWAYREGTRSRLTPNSRMQTFGRHFGTEFRTMGGWGMIWLLSGCGVTTMTIHWMHSATDGPTRWPSLGGMSLAIGSYH